jgi:all-trans-retinol 13,14-reductase
MTKIPGLFLAGQGVIAPGVLGAVISGMVACGMIVGENELLEQVVRCKCKEL